MDIYLFLSPCTHIKFKWIQDLHIKPDTLKLIEEEVWKRLNTKAWENFLNRKPMASALRSRFHKRDLINI